MMKFGLMSKAASANMVNWVDMGCNSVECQYRNPSTSSDMVVTMFFQVEDPSNTASFKCVTGDQVHCQRSWTVEEQGSAGTCFFMLGSGEEFSCSGTGTITWIGGHAAPLQEKILTTTVSHLACEGGQASDCKTGAANFDQWVELSFKPSEAGESGFRCHVDGKAVCHYTAKNSMSASSCGFLVPQGSSLSCASLQGAVTATSATSRVLSQNLGPVASAEQDTCPPSSSDPTLCNCKYTNTDDHDKLVAISAGNADNAFNSFHCWVGSSNTCAWGVNNGQNGWTGTCYFILPAGAEYECDMQYGATAFPEVTVVSLSGPSIFPKSSQQLLGTHPSTANHVVSSRSQEDMHRLFSEYTARHGNVSPDRFDNFKRYVAMVDNHPTNPPLKSGSDLSPLAVLTLEEFESSYRNCAKTEPVTGLPFRVSAKDLNNTPSSVDWRSLGAVTPVKDQGQCGSCWAFSTTGVLEGAWAAGGHGLQSLSEQHLVSCDNSDGNLGCGGGWPYKAVDFVHQNGIDTETSYPYNSASGTSGPCASSSGTLADIQVASHAIIDSDEDQIAAWVAKNGPVSISIDAMSSIWWSYTGGIVDGCCNHDPDHAVLVAGFGEENGQKYWLVKNSWGESWGEQGYIRLERGSNQCGITYQPVGVVISGAPTPVPPPSPVPTPAPRPPSPSPTPPSPTPSGRCPTDAQTVSKDGSFECLWTSGTGGLTIPSTAREYCTYISSGYLGYTWPSSDGDYSCAPSARKSSNGGTNFCVWEDGSLGVSIPSGSVADCSSLSQGRIGFIPPALLI